MRYFAGIIILILFLAGLATAVSAHDAAIIKSVPANGDVLAQSPSEVMAWFAEELISGESTMRVFSTLGVQVDNGDGGVNLNDPDHASMIVTLPPLSDGSYTVQWHATLLDGDATDGAFAFAVGEGQSVLPAAVPQAVAEEGDQSVGSLMPAIVVGLIVLLLIGGLAMRRRQS
jgi:methionine-rich copper-binding protein CopC